MTVEKMIERLEKYNPEAEVKMHGMHGNNVLFVVGYENNNEVVIIEDKEDVDLKTELEARFEAAGENNEDELDFYIDLLDDGYALDDIKEYLPDRYEMVKLFLEDHGLF